MSYFAHDAIVVTAYDDDMADTIDRFRESMPEGLRPLLAGPLRAPVDCYCTWFFAPDCGPEGRPGMNSELGDIWRAKFLELFKDDPDRFDIVGVRYGGDHGIDHGAVITYDSDHGGEDQVDAVVAELRRMAKEIQAATIDEWYGASEAALTTCLEWKDRLLERADRIERGER